MSKDDEDLNTIDGLNAELASSIRDIRSGKMPPSAANAITARAGTIFRGVKLQLEIAKASGLKPGASLRKRANHA